MRIGIPKERYPNERRVAVSPEAASQIQDLGYQVSIETEAGLQASFSDQQYRDAGCAIVQDPQSLYASADIILKVRPPGHLAEQNIDEIGLLRPGQIIIGFLQPSTNEALLQKLAEKKVTALAMESIPRISRAQKMDALSSMSNIAGYRAVIEAAHHFGRFFTGQITAAGKIEPAKILVIGAGVAGLSAIGTAKSMGAIVRAFDTRPEVKEQVESMNGEFLMLEFNEEDGSGEGGYAKVMSEEFIRAEMALFGRQAKEVDIIITTALIPGREAPELITKEMVESMKNGSVIVDLAAEMGGNCKSTVPDQVIQHQGVTLIGYTDLPARLPTQASRLYGTNLRHLLSDLTPQTDGKAVIDMEDEIIRGATVVKEGKITWPPPPPKITATPEKEKVQPPRQPEPKKKQSPVPMVVAGSLCAALMLMVGWVAPPEFMNHFTVFVLACFVGYMVIWNVTPSLHTPLMSVTNAISSIIILGALLKISSQSGLIVFLSFLAVLITSINIFGGFSVTQRMLAMFRKQEK